MIAHAFSEVIGVLQVSATDAEITAGRVGLGADFGRAEFDDVRVTVHAP